MSDTIMHRVIVVLFACATAVAIPASTAENIVRLPFGAVRGNVNEDAREFLGIPFATSTRFEAPEPWSQPYKAGELDASRFTPACIQYSPPGSPGLGPGVPESEDCLHLNIYTPRAHAATSNRGFPVMVWIHGGGLTEGTAMSPFYNGSLTAKRQGVVVVAVNYRLNMLGFSAFRGASSNNGFRDQLEALRWVANHVGAFGGDPDIVTIYGESAGGQSVGVHIVSPLSGKGLFHRAISESGDISNTVPLSQRINQTARVAAEVGCVDLACMKRVVNVSSITGAISSLGLDMSPAVEGDDLLPHPPLELIKAGAFHKVPYMLGNNENEGSLFIDAKTVTATQARCVIDYLKADAGPGFEGLYPIIEGQDNRNALVDLVSDVTFHCPNREIGLALGAAGEAPWMYSFKRSPACPLFGFGLNVTGAAHASEIAYVFQELFTGTLSCMPPQEDVALAKAIGDLWGLFAREGRQIRSWPRFEAATKAQVAKLDVGLDIHDIDTETGYRRGFCALLSQVSSTFQYRFPLALRKCI